MPLPREFRLPLALLGIAGAAVLTVSVAGAMQDKRHDPQDIAWHNAQQAYLASLKPADGWQPVAGGLKWRLVSGDGSGPRPSVNDTVTVHYTGRFIDGQVFDSSVERGEPATFPLGQLVKAWQIAIPLMGVGDTIEIAAPADLAYGPKGRGPIPGGATLLFTVELRGIE
jgi:FKBP-type peptidyl-prolyl cis-trans isomerase